MDIGKRASASSVSNSPLLLNVLLFNWDNQ